MSFPTGPTPPPPNQPPTPAVAPEPAGPGLSEGARLIDTFIAPSKTFEDIRRNASWWVPFLLISVCTVCFFLMIDKKVGFDEIARNMMSSNKSVQQLSPAQQEQAIARVAFGLKIGIYTGPVFILVYVLIIAAVLMATFNFVMDARVPFKQALAIVMYGWLPGVVSGILSIVSLAYGNPEGFRMENPIGTNPAYFLDFNSTSKFAYVMASSLDVIAIWMIVLIGIGFALNAWKKLSIGSAIGVVAGWYFLWKLISAGLAALRG